MPFLKRNRILIAFFFIIVLAGSLFWFDSKYTPKANARSCKIYQAYYANLEEDLPHIFRPISNSIPVDPINKSFELFPFFDRDTGKREIVKSEYFSKPYEKIVYEKFAFDSASIFKNSVLSAPQDIRSCFHGVINAPTISILPAKTIEFLRFGAQPFKNEDGLTPAFNANFLTVHELSSPLITNDNKYGLIFVESYCGPLCGHGGYFLFENINGDWKQIGFHSRWVS